MTRLLDLYSGAGGAGAGYMQAGFDVTGIDHIQQPRYPGTFIQGDALAYLEKHGREYDVIHASPPCQRYANVTGWRGQRQTHPDLLPATLALLAQLGVPWIVENVPEAPLRRDVLLCGSQFGLRIRRHRAFMVSWPLFSLLPPCQHTHLLPFMHKGERAYADAMECHWMNKTEAREAIPPAYTRWLGGLALLMLAPSCLTSSPH